MKKKVATVVLNWNRWKDTISCLESLSHVDAFSFNLEVLVVDNASSDDSIHKLEEFKKKFDFKLIKNAYNLGFAEGNNVGLRYAISKGFDYVMVLNNDTLVDRKIFSYLLSVFEDNRRVGVVSPKIYFAKGFEFHKERYSTRDLGKVIWYAGGKVDWDNVMGINSGVDEVDQGQFEEIKEVDFATGCSSIFSVSVLKKIGLYDKRYFMYFEDVDLSLRIKKAGYKVMFQPKGIVWHKVAQSSGIGSDLNDYFISRNRLLFGFKYAPTRTKMALFRESLRFLLRGRKWQKIGVRDFYLGKFEKGSWK
jgi:GT2 family glycosyltransferase